MPYILIQVNEGIVKLVTLMVKGNEIITKMKECKCTSNFVEINLIPSMWPILQYLHLHISMILHWFIKQF